MKHIKHFFKRKPAVVTDTPESAPQASGAVKDWSFKKIDVAETASDKPRKKGKFLKIVGALTLILVILLIVVGVAGFSVYLSLKTVMAQATDLQTSGTELASFLKKQDLEGTKTKLPEVRQKLDTLKKSWDGVTILKSLPYLKDYHADGVHGLNAASYGLDALEITISTVEPYADLLGLKGKSNFVAGSADQRIQLAVQTLDKVTPKISEIGDKINSLKKEADQIDPNRYPEEFQGKKIRSKIIEGKTLLDDTTGLFLNAQPLLEVLPQLLGQPTQKRYLVLFQNDKELRPTGGFLTAYAIFNIKQGKFTVEKSNDIYELDGQITKKTPAPEDILTYHKGVYYFYIRDSNLSPDFSTSMKQFMSLYPNKWDFDGIVAVDTHVLVEAIKILGTFVVKGRTFSAEIDKRCDCPKVIYELEDYSTKPLAYIVEQRKDVLGDLLLQIMKKALGVSPSQYWGQLFQMALSEIQQKHILAYMTDEKSQKGIESLNMGGRIADGVEILGYKDGQNWDYLHINDANMAGAKSNLFVQPEVKQEYAVDTDGTVTKTLTIDYKNPSPGSDCNLESGGLCLNGILRNWLRVYVPKGSTLLEGKGSQSPKDGSAIDFLTKEDLGKTMFEGFLTVRPLGSSQVVLKYKLPFKASGTLSVLMQKQPGTDNHLFTTIYKGKQRDSGPLQTDKVLNIKL
jgi:hypothetical protein